MAQQTPDPKLIDSMAMRYSEHLAQQTAVGWLVDQVEDFIGLIPIDIIQQAEEMFQQQIIDAANGYTQTEYLGATRGEQYYNETYGK